MVAARATRLPIYSSFAKEGNLSDIFAKGEAISTLFNVAGIGVGIQLASTVCSSMEGKVISFCSFVYSLFENAVSICLDCNSVILVKTDVCSWWLGRFFRLYMCIVS